MLLILVRFDSERLCPGAKLKAVPVLINLFKRYLAGYVMSPRRTCEGRLNGPLQIHGRSHDHPETNIGAHQVSAEERSIGFAGGHHCDVGSKVWLGPVRRFNNPQTFITLAFQAFSP